MTERWRNDEMSEPDKETSDATERLDSSNSENDCQGVEKFAEENLLWSLDELKRQ